MKPSYEELEEKLVASIAAERVWETAMMKACGEDGPKSVADKFAALEAKCAALAAEVYDLKHPGTYLPSKRETPALDAFLAEVRASALPADVMAAIQKVACIRLDLNEFDGDKRGIIECLSDAEESLIAVVNRLAAQLRHGGAA
ncbi:TPA: hypothetical protein ACJINY_001935 [Escherichia coli]